LQVSIIGYNAIQLPVEAQSSMKIILKEASNQLDVVVKQAYSKTSQRLATGSITKISSEEIAKQPVMNPLMALQGRVPGLVVTPTNGFASAPVRMEIRGLNSLNAKVPSDPLYVIDGVPLTVLSMGDEFNRTSTGFIQGINYTYPSGNTTNGLSPLFSINPRDIESIEILKDADATAVYGARGANGVILITTKKGKPGPSRFEFDVTPPFFTIGKTTRFAKLMNTQQYLQMRREAFKNSGETPTILTAPDLLLWDTTRYTDWQKETLGGRAKSLSVSIGLSGGTDQTIFRVNANYNRETNTSNISGATQRYTLAAQIGHTTKDRKFSINFSSKLAYMYVDVLSRSPVTLVAPNAPPMFDKDGNPNWSEWNADGLLNIYPFGRDLKPANPQKTTALTNSLMLDYKPFKGFTLSLLTGYNFSHNNTKDFLTIAARSPYISNVTGEASFSTTTNTSVLVNPQATYQTRLGRGNLELSLVGTSQFTETNVTSQYGYGYTNDILLGSIKNAGGVIVSDAFKQLRNASFIGHVNYNYDNRYIINLNGTRQGSSKFGPANKYGSFGSAAFAWIASEENWLKPVLPKAINFLKFSASYGMDGSDGIDEYQYLELWTIQNMASGGGYNGQMVLIPSIRPNQKYKWENNRKFNSNLVMGLFKDRVNLSLTYYQNRVSNQLTAYPTPAYVNGSDINAIITNIPMLLENRGWEGSIDVKLVSTQDFSLTALFNFSRNRNRLLSFPGIDQTPYAGQYAIGKSINMASLLHYKGVDPLTGAPAFEDYNKDGKITWNGLVAPPPGSDDRAIVYDLQPGINGGFGLQGNFKKLSFSLFFVYKKQKGYSLYTSVSSPGIFNQNMPPDILGGHWQQPGDIASYPAFSTVISNPYFGLMAVSDAAYTDASYIRLNNISLTYPLPESWGRTIGLKNLSVSLSGQNIFTITRYNGGDPETMSLFGMPPSNLYTIRFNYNF
jgi:TonB-linked SusC/RagA family outer membrane protein